jgi:(R,R)-butanediol dehydrogenase/meso-butanediol dehydrogenase/diacetyl reductase
VRIEDIPEPELRPGAVKIAVAWCGICGTDLHEFLEGPIFIPPPGRPHPLTGESAPVTLGHHPVGDIPLDEAALIEPLAVAYHAVGRSGVQAGDVAVVGWAGPIGLLTAAVLKGIGATTIVTELSAARKEKAVSSGVADHLLDPSSDDVKARVLELANGLGADAAFECAGVNAVLDTMPDVVKPAGVVVNVSIWGRPATVDMQKIVLKKTDLRGTIGYRGDHPAAIKLVQEGKVDLEPFMGRLVKK